VALGAGPPRVPTEKEHVVGVAGPGVPGWVDLGTPDIEASKTFYSELFSWDPQTSPDPQYGGYTTFTLDGRPVAGAGPLMMEGQPTAWSSYVIVDDAQGTAEKVAAAGGTVIAPPMEVGDQGTMAVFLDPTGAAIGVWQPAKMTGAEVLNEPGALCWTELATRDVEAAKPFYRAVFGWEPDNEPNYTQFFLNGKSIAGMMPMGDSFPPEVPPHWGIYFAVTDCEAAVEGATRGGGSLTVPPTDIPQGRFAGVVDPQGAPFYVIALA
jgi:predicted enzyme related to lactoylglutathione lyase